MGRRVWIVVLFFAQAAWASSLSLKEAMQLARQKHASVQAARLQEQAAREKLREAKGFRLPHLRFEEVFIRTDSPAEAFALKLNQERFSFASFMTADPNRPEKLNTGISRFQLDLPLYTGGELAARITQAEQFAASKSQERVWEENRAALAAAEAYVALAQAREYVSLLEKARDTVQAHVALARAYVEQGMLVESELLRAEVELARVEDMLAQAKGQEQVAQANLAFRLGLSQEEQFQLEPLPLPAGLGEDLSAFLASAQGRPDLQAAREMASAAQWEVKARQALFYPRAGLVARADWVDSKLFGTHGDSTTVMAAVGMDLFAGGSHRAALAAARAEAQAAAAQVSLFSEAVMLEVRQAFTQAQVAISRLETARKALRAAAEVQRITEERFRQGVVKMLDLLDADTARREAETRELVARAEAHQALLQLAVKAGRQPETALP
jgi:outer membrane protein TolC